LAAEESSNQVLADGPTTTILVIDDDPDIREALADCLTDASFRVVCAENGVEALAYLRSSAPPAAIIVDLFMPVMDGWELLKRLNSDAKLSRIPVIVVTAAGDHWGHPVPPTMLVRKPLEVSRLLRVIRSATAGARPV
jgi:CheY-like chemotaxis protein